MANRKVIVSIIPYCNIYVTTIIKGQDCTEEEQIIISKTAKLYSKVAEDLGGELYELPVHLPLEVGETVFYNTFVFPTGEMAHRYIEFFSNI